MIGLCYTEANTRRMARRPDFSDKPLSVEDLLHLRHRLDRMSLHEVREYYQHRLRDCQLLPGRLPKSQAVQSLVAAWRSLRSRRDRL
jgi:hypothetical protein